VQQRTGWARDLRVRVSGKGVVSHVGSALLRLLGDKVGLTAALCKALKVRGFTPDIDRSRILADLAVAVADGATAIDDLKTLRHQGDLFGPVASTTTAWRCLDEIGELQLARIDRARARPGPRGWARVPGSFPDPICRRGFLRSSLSSSAVLAGGGQYRDDGPQLDCCLELTARA
jgi:hypothetical protein